MVNKPLIRPYFSGGTFGGGWLTSHGYITVRPRTLSPVTPKIHILQFREGIPPIDAFFIQNENDAVRILKKNIGNKPKIAVALEYVLFPFPSNHCQKKNGKI